VYECIFETHVPKELRPLAGFLNKSISRSLIHIPRAPNIDKDIKRTNGVPTPPGTTPTTARAFADPGTGHDDDAVCDDDEDPD
jgi:hypothetical protein